MIRLFVSGIIPTGHCPNIVLLIPFLSLLSCFSCKQRTTAEMDWLSGSAAELMEEPVSAAGFSGAIALAAGEGVVWKNAYGTANRESNLPFSTATPTYLASVSKQFTAASILLLQQDGKLCIEDPVSLYLSGLPEYMEEVRIRHLLQHTSGIQDYYQLVSPTPGFTNRDVLAIVQNLDGLKFTPGDRHEYSNTGYVLLSQIVESVSGISFGDFVTRNIFDKLGMYSSAVLDEASELPSGKAISYPEEGKVADYSFRTTGGGGIYSTADDLLRWHRALKNGKVIRRDLLEQEAWQPAVLQNGDTSFYGLGWRIDPEEAGVVWHDGTLEGYRTFFLHDDRRNLAVIVLNNSAYPDLEKLGWQLYLMIKERYE